MKIALAQLDLTVGDLDGNTAKIIVFMEKAKGKADLVIFPELAIVGYPPKDLLLKPSFIRENRKRLDEIIERADGIAAVLGFVDGSERKLYNSAAFIVDGELVGAQAKINLPNYDVFDEKRYFQPGDKSELFELNGKKLGINLCEDIWVEGGPCEIQAKEGADLIVNISASPFNVGKNEERLDLLAKRARVNEVPIAYCNLVGGQDDLVFDGGSCFVNSDGSLLVQGKRFQEGMVFNDPAVSPAPPISDPAEEVYRALVLGIRDYTLKNGFKRVIIGLSGGIDSSLAAALAVEALGSENVVGVFMPSEITSLENAEDAEALAKNMGMEFKVVPITRGVKAFDDMLAAEFKGTEAGVAEENIQARLRGNILMALSNKFGYLVLSAGNKSEMAVGYTTLYGDLAGGLAVISDVPKTMVYSLARYANAKAGKDIILKRILKKEPTAELRPGQKDAEDLPPYEVLDPILKAYIEDEKAIDEIVAMGFERSVVVDMIKRVDRNEYKREQAPPGIRVTSKAFGSGRRMPITNKYRGPDSGAEGRILNK
ncbi:MAG: NAD+ synthase [Candidatus Hydrothermarchaeales archaeon]